MKKSVAAALAAAVVMGVSSTSFAAANPFSDVPAGHWAYKSVTDLAEAGIVDGYGDGTYRGDRVITRYEMAQMVAKALANIDRYEEIAGISSSSRYRTDLDALKAEFQNELRALGVLEAVDRVNEMWPYRDKVVWQGKIEYTYKSHRTDNVYDNGHTRVNQDDWIFRFEPIATVNDHWTLRARIDAHVDLSRNTSTDFNLVRGWAQGDYDNFQIKVGKQPLYTNEDGIVWDTEYSGAEITFGKLSNGLRATVYGGRLSDGTVVGALRNAGAWNGRQDNVGADRWDRATGRIGRSGSDPSSFWAVNIQYDPGAKGLFGGAAYYNIKDDDLRNFVDASGNTYRTYSNDGDTNKAKIWSVNMGYRVGKGQIWGAFAKNTEADVENNSWQALVRYGDLYGGGNQNTHKGQWAVWAGYKKLGSNTSLCAINWDDAFAGTKGVVAGASWAPMDRVVFLAKYFKGKYIEGRGDAERLFGRVEFFF